VVAETLASAGYPAAGEVLQGAAGFFQTFYQQEGDYAQLLDQLGSRFEIVLVGPKPFPSCRYTHCAVTGVLERYANMESARDIQEVRGSVSDMRRLAAD
jgi:2-methylcitrate dehydratase PrpD